MKTQITAVCLLIGTLTTFGQLPQTSLFDKSNQVEYQIPEDATELIEKRDLYQRVFKTNDGRIIHHSSKSPLNFKNKQGEWFPVDITPSMNMDGGYTASSQHHPVTLSSNGNIIIENESGVIFKVETIELFGNKKMNSGKPVLSNENVTEPKLMGKVVRQSLNEGIIQQSAFRQNGIKVDYIIEQGVNTETATIKQQLICPSGYTLKKHQVMHHALSIVDERGVEMGILYPIICTDASGEYSLGEYAFQKNKTGFEITLSLDKNWFQSSARNYPITVDPLIVGPTALWAGGYYIPSCFVPAYSSDSLLVTIPGQTTITEVYVSGSYYSDPWTGTTMSQGQMYFSTSCAQTGTLTVAPPAGSTPGTAYLTDGTYRNPLTCCMGPSCVDRTFYLRMHIGRTAGGAGCNTTYIYHDPFSLYPFSCYVEGRTIEAAGTQWVINLTGPLCSDECDFSFKPYVRYGVPPYTITHPWAGGPTSLGTPIYTCALTSFNVNIDVTRPGCPILCDTTSIVNVPTPTIVDACGNMVTGLPAKIINIKPTPDITVVPDSILVCSGDPAQFTFNVCPAGTTVDWYTAGFNGTNSIDTSFINTGTTINQQMYWANANLNGCSAATDSMAFFISPNPVAAASYPSVAFIDEPINFIDTTIYSPGAGSIWGWSFGDGTTSSNPNPIHSYSSPGTYNVCLIVQSNFGCMDTICDTIKVVPNQLTLPNLLTTNNDGLNDVLYFEYLPFYGISTLQVFNRWGEIIYESDDYQNNWQPTKLVDGTYFYIITIPGQDPYTSTLNIFNSP